MLIAYLPCFFKRIALLLLAMVMPWVAQGATVSYNDTLSFKGLQDVTATISINFNYHTDTSMISDVSGIYNDGALSYKIYNHYFPQGDPTPDFLNILFVNTDINFSRRNYFNTYFFVDNSAIDPLTLAYRSDYYHESSAVVFCTIAKCTDFTPLEEKLTNLTAVPVPSAFALFAAALMGLTVTVKKQQQTNRLNDLPNNLGAV